MTGQPWFFLLLLSDPECLRYAAQFLAGFFGFLLMASIYLSIRKRLTDEDWHLYELSQPVEIFHCSPSCEMRCWDGTVEFVRSGACVGRVRDGAASIRWTGGKTDRVIEITYGGGGFDSFHCGPVGLQEAKRAAAIAMRYTGRHDYGKFREEGEARLPEEHG